MHYCIAFCFTQKGFIMIDALFNCSEYSVANYLIQIAKEADLDLINIQLNNTMLLLEGWALKEKCMTLCHYTEYFKSGKYSAILPNIYGYFVHDIGSIKDPIVDAGFKHGKLAIKKFPELPQNNKAFNKVAHQLLFTNSFNAVKNHLDTTKPYQLLHDTDIVDLYNDSRTELLKQGNIKYQKYLQLKAAGYSPAFINDAGTKKLQIKLSKATKSMDSTLKRQIIDLVNQAYLTGRGVADAGFLNYD